jgi:surface protein
MARSNSRLGTNLQLITNLLIWRTPVIVGQSMRHGRAFFTRHLALFLSALLVTSGFTLVVGAPAKALPLNSNSSVFQITFTGLTSLPNKQTLVSPNGIQVAWTKGTQPTDADWIDVTSTVTPLTTVKVPISGNHSGVTATVPTGIIATDTIMLTIRDNPNDAITASLGGYLGNQEALAGAKTLTTLGEHGPTSGNTNGKELISFGQFAGFQYLQDAFAGIPTTFVISAQLPTTVTDLSYSFGSQNMSTLWNRDDITAWDVSRVTNFAGMFYKAGNFNQDISGWDTSSATDMSSMFRLAGKFNQPIGSWDTSSVTNMSSMFLFASLFNAPLDDWDTSRVTKMDSMFMSAAKFNQDLNSWDTSQVTDMNSMFYQASMFNGSIGAWDTSKVTNMNQFLRSASAFNKPIGSWDVSKVTNMSYMLSNCAIFNQSLSGWDTANVLDMSNLFANSPAFNGDISTWNTAKVTRMDSMFNVATNFNIDISGWNTSKVTNMNSMFYNARNFNRALSSWNTARVLDMSSMFYGATAFNGNISGWNTGQVMKMESMFYNATNFNSDISSWNTSRTINMRQMFYGAAAFNQPIGSWDTRFVTNMGSMFAAASTFNQPIGNWNTANVTDMSYMFASASAFNSPLDGWNVSKVTSFISTFNGASAFNQSLNSWTPLDSSSRAGMLYNANSFNQPLYSFPISIPSATSSSTGSTFILPSSMSQANAEETLATWANQTPPNPTYIQLASNLKWYTDCRSYAGYQRLSGVGNLSKSGGATNPAVPTGCTTSTISWTPSLTNTSPSIENGVLSFTPSQAPTGSSDIRFSSRTRECLVNPITGEVSYKSTATSCVIRAWDNDPNGSMDYTEVTFTLTKYTVPGAVNASIRSTETGWNLYWTAPSNSGSFPVTNYLVKNQADSQIFCYVPATELSCDVTDLNPGASYLIYFYAISDAGVSPMDYTNANYDVKPGAPTITSIVPGSGLSLTVNFTAGTSPGTPTTIYEYSTNGGTNWKTSTIVSSTSLTLPNQSNNPAFVGGTTYSILIRAKNQYTTSDASAAADGTPLDRQIGAPTITSYTTTSNDLSVYFTAPALTGSAISTYQYSTDGGSTWRARIGTTSSPIVITAKSDTGTSLVENTAYTVKIRAVTAAGNGLPSAGTTMTPLNLPAVPTSPQATLSGTTATVSWTASATGYGITYSVASTPAGFTCSVSPPTTTCDISGLTRGTSYTFKVTATNGAGSRSSVNSNSVTPDIAPGAPTISGITSGVGQLSVAFTSGSNTGTSITKYQYSTDGGTNWSNFSSNSVTSPQVITGLTSGTSYDVKLRAFNTVAGEPSNSVTATPGLAPGAPTSVIAVAGEGEATVSWTAPSSNGGVAISSYTATSSIGGRTCTANSPSTSCVVSGLTNGQSYTFTVTATNTIGTSAASIATSAVIPEIAPEAPGVLRAVPGDRQLSIYWRAGTNTGSAITKYQYTTDNVNWKDLVGLSSPFVLTQDSTNANLINGQDYVVYLRAVNTLPSQRSQGLTHTPNVPINAPVITSITRGDAQLTIAFTPGPSSSGTALTKYMYSTDGGTTWLPKLTTTSPFTITLDSSGSALVNGTTYSVSIAGYNTILGNPSTTVSATPKGNQADLNWNMPTTSVENHGTLTLATTGGSGTGQVIYSAGPSCSVVNNILTAGDAGGTCTVTATKTSDSTYASKDVSSDLVITITKSAQATTPFFTNSSSVVYGQTLTLAGSGGSGPGVLSYSVQNAGTTGCSVDSVSGILSVTATGTCVVNVQRAASTNFNASLIGSQSVAVTSAPQTIEFTSTIPTTPVAGDTYGVSATSSSGLSVTLSIQSGSCTISSGTVTFDSSGACVIKASRSSTSQYSAASDKFQTITVGQRNQVITYSTASRAILNKTYGDTSFTVSATSSEATAVVTFSVHSSTTNTACSVNTEGLVQVLAVGNCVIEANAASSSAYAAASPVLLTIPVVSDVAAAPFITSLSAGNQSITVTFTEPSYTGGSDITGYQVAAVPQSGSSQMILESGCGITATNGVLTCTVRTLSNGVDYKIKVAAINAAGLGVYTELSNSLTAATNPSAVQGLGVVQDNAQLIVSWSDPDSLGGGTFVEYRIFVKRSTAGSYDQLNFYNVDDDSLNTVTLTAESPSGTPLVNGIGYDIKVITVTSANSAELTANTAVVNQIPRTVPDAPRFAAAFIMGASIVLSWETPDSDGGAPISSYAASVGSSPCTFSANDDTYCTVSLPNTYEVSYEVKAVNVAGQGAPATGSLQISAPPVPETLAPSNSGSSNTPATRTPTKRSPTTPTESNAPDEEGIKNPEEESPEPKPSSTPVAQESSDSPGANELAFQVALAILTALMLMFFVFGYRRRSSRKTK